MEHDRWPAVPSNHDSGGAELMDDDELDGCDVVHNAILDEVVPDKDLEAHVLFAGVAPEDVKRVEAEWKGLFGGT